VIVVPIPRRLAQLGAGRARSQRVLRLLAL